MFRCVPFVVLAFVMFALPDEAGARRRGFYLITFGEQMSEIAPAADGSAARAESSDAKVGYRYDHFGVFWIPIWTWGGEYCVYSDSDNSYMPGEPEELAAYAGVSADLIGKPFGYRVPYGLLILLAIGAIALFQAMPKRESKTEEETVRATGLRARNDSGLHISRTMASLAVTIVAAGDASFFSRFARPYIPLRERWGTPPTKPRSFATIGNLPAVKRRPVPYTGGRKLRCDGGES